MGDRALILEYLATREKSWKAKASSAEKPLEDKNTKNDQQKCSKYHLQIASAGNAADVQRANDHDHRDGDRDNR